MNRVIISTMICFFSASTFANQCKEMFEDKQEYVSDIEVIYKHLEETRTAEEMMVLRDIESDADQMAKSLTLVLKSLPASESIAFAMNQKNSPVQRLKLLKSLRRVGFNGQQISSIGQAAKVQKLKLNFIKEETDLKRIHEDINLIVDEYIYHAHIANKLIQLLYAEKGISEIEKVKNQTNLFSALSEMNKLVDQFYNKLVEINTTDTVINVKLFRALKMKNRRFTSN